MFQGFEASWPHLIACKQSPDLIAPEQAYEDSMLKATVSIVDSLGKQVFAKRWPRLSVRWGIEFDDDPNAFVYRSEDGHVHVVLTSGACGLMAEVGAFVASDQWLVRYLYPLRFAQAPPRSFTTKHAGEAAQMLGLAALFGHELGHALDLHYVDAKSGRDRDAPLAEEISADGHAILAGLAIVDAWAFDLAQRGAHSETDFRRLGATLLVLANTVMDDLEFGASWNGAPDQTHPPGVQRLMAACVHLNDHFEKIDSGVGIDIFEDAIIALSAMGIYKGPVGGEAVELFFADYDPEVINRQYEVIKNMIDERRRSTEI